MKYLLDTNVCINFLNGRSNSIRNELERHSPQEIFLCSIVVAELYYGSIKSARPVENIQRIAHFIDHFVSLPFDNQASRVYGEIRSVLETSGQPIGPMDNHSQYKRIYSDQRIKNKRLGKRQLAGAIFMDPSAKTFTPLSLMAFPV
jgi:tRNA(fMet)-specific endonuclease VapC